MRHQDVAEGYVEASDISEFLSVAVRAQTSIEDQGHVFRKSGIFF